MTLCTNAYLFLPVLLLSTQVLHQQELDCQSLQTYWYHCHLHGTLSFHMATLTGESH